MYPSMKLNPYPEYNAYIPQVNPRAASLRNEDDDKYIVTTKIMVLALAVLFAVVFFVVCLHIYAKWIWSTAPARSTARLSFSFWRRRRNRDRSDEIVLDADALDINMVMGLGKAAVEALPKFRYEECEHHLECPICLGKFEEGEMGRALPKCGHCFHLECIDMWLFSHSTCPLCRAVLDPDVEDSIAEAFNLEPPSPEPATDSVLPEDDQGDKRADAIPANVLFWGNHTQGPPSLELTRISVNNNSSQTAAPSPQVVIEVEQVADSLLPRGGGSLHRLLGRGVRVLGDGGNVVVTPFRPAPYPSPSPSPSSSSSSSRFAAAVAPLRGHGGVFSAEEP